MLRQGAERAVQLTNLHLISNVRYVLLLMFKSYIYNIQTILHIDTMMSFKLLFLLLCLNAYTFEKFSLSLGRSMMSNGIAEVNGNGMLHSSVKVTMHINIYNIIYSCIYVYGSYATPLGAIRNYVQ